MSIFDVRHQPTAHAVTQRALTSGRLAHGLLLAGPGGVGREMFAQRLAALLLCERPVQVADGAQRAGLDAAGLPDGLAPARGVPWQDACGRCESCRLAAAGTHPDIHLVYRELSRTIPELKNRQGLELYIDVIRQYVIDAARIKPGLARGKAFIIRDAHLMNDEAQNALLKTLEEPPPGTWLILLTDQAHQLRETIRSRCQLVRFSLLPTEFVREQLSGTMVGQRKVDAEEATYLAARSGGRLGEAVRLAEADLFGVHQELATRLADLGRDDAVDLGDWLEELTKQLGKEQADASGVTDSQAQKEVAADLLATMALVLGDALRVAGGAAGDDPLFAPVANKLAGGPDVEDRLNRLARAIDACSRAGYLIVERFVNPRLALDELTLELSDALAG
ncbi:MAG: hypothetical protein BIFFINMI_01326 [Phycisphaerae bacterium]|nr:hypothetical protein [Phycisphaerae bacterium]